MIGADCKLSDHEGMHCATGHIAPKAEGTWLVGDEAHGGCLARICLDRNPVSINEKSMHYICADEFNRDGIAGVDL